MGVERVPRVAQAGAEASFGWFSPPFWGSLPFLGRSGSSDPPLDLARLVSVWVIWPVFVAQRGALVNVCDAICLSARFFSDCEACFCARITVRFTRMSCCLAVASEVGKIRLLHHMFFAYILCSQYVFGVHKGLFCLCKHVCTAVFVSARRFVRRSCS